VFTQLACEVELVCLVSAGAFSPAPKVDSAAVRLRRRPNHPNNLAELLAFAARCFAQKRKTIRNNLRPFYGSAIDSLPEARLRAEQLSIEQIQDLFTRLETTVGADPPVH
jgi:16S rRNA (adenine1518-N6/adenine1519-N6)-dimethyltransferase